MRRFSPYTRFLVTLVKYSVYTFALDAINQPATLSPSPASHTTPPQTPAVPALLDQPAAQCSCQPSLHHSKTQHKILSYPYDKFTRSGSPISKLGLRSTNSIPFPNTPTPQLKALQSLGNRATRVSTALGDNAYLQ